VAIALLQGCAKPDVPAIFTTPYPHSGSELRKQMDTALETGDRAALTRAVLALAWMGGTLSDTGFETIAPNLDRKMLASVRPPPLFADDGDRVEALHRWLRSNGEPHHSAMQADGFAEVPAEYRLVEGIAWDAKARRLFVGTVVDGRLAYLEGNAWHAVPLGSPRAGLFGMAVDTVRRLLWIATGSVPQVAMAGERMAGLIAVDLESLKVVRRVPLPAGGNGAAGDVAIGADGTVYVSVTSGAIARCRPGCGVLEDLLPAGSFRSPQGMVAAADGSRLYVADYSTGLWIVDPTRATMRPAKGRGPAMLEGIDGLVAVPGRGSDALVAIQNGTRPRRIVKLLLDRDGDGLSVQPRTIVSGDAGEPTLGTVIDDDLLFIADGQWERYGKEGAPTDDKPARPTPIHRLRLEDVVVTRR
jgi:hypothetical protein